MQRKSPAHNGIRDADVGSKLRRIFHVCHNPEDNGSAPGSISRVLFSHLALGFCLSPQMVLNGKNQVTGSERFCNATNLLQPDKEVSFLLLLLWWNVHTKHLHNPPLQHCSPSHNLLSLASNTPENHTGNPEFHPLEGSGTKKKKKKA